MHNAKCNCLNCPAVKLKTEFDAGLRAQLKLLNSSRQAPGERNQARIRVECRRRPELGEYNPLSIQFKDCPEWRETEYGLLLKNMNVMILGIDGYLGWTLALFLGSLGCKISGVDNYNRRNCVKERGSHTVVPIARMNDRLQVASGIAGVPIDFRQIDILNERQRLKEFVDEVKPEVIVHYGENPSAPYSMIDADHAIEVQANNVLGTLGLLFIMREVVPEAVLLKLGTMGEYGAPMSGRPIFEGVFPPDAIMHWNNGKWDLGGELLPRDPGSFYHISKAQDTLNIFEACKYWGLRSYDIMQGVIFGVHTKQVASDERLRTRLDIDEWFGTIVNRFVAQAIIGIPLTLFGAGHQKRGFIALEDAMECMTRLISSPPILSQYEVVNQISNVYSARDLAYSIAKIGRKHFKLDVEIQRVENPRVEADEHPYNVIHEKLPNNLGFQPKIKLEEEIFRMFELLIRSDITQRIEQIRHLILPKTWWSGRKIQVKRLELMELEEELRKEKEGLKIS